MAVANGWSNPDISILGRTYEYTKTVNGVKYTVAARSNAKRITSITVTAAVTGEDAKTGATTNELVRGFFEDYFLPLLNNNIGTGTQPF